MMDFLIQNDVARYLMLAIIFILVAFVAIMVTNAIGERREVRERLDLAGAHPAEGTTSSLRNDATQSRWIDIVNRIEKTGLSLVDTRDESLRKRLIAAGYSSAVAPRVYTLIRLLLVIGLPVLLMLYMWLAGSSPTAVKLYFGLVVAMVAGLYLPSLFIRAKADRRQQEIVNGFPDALDLMLV